MSERLVLEAIEQGDAERLEEALARDPSAASARDTTGVSALLLARYRGRTDLVETLTRARGSLDLFEAAALGDVGRLRELVDAEPELVNAWSADGFTPLHLAAFFGQAEAVDLLLDRDADVEAVSRNGLRVRPLNSAAAAAERAICARLIAHGADVDSASAGGFTPLHAAAQNGDAELVHLLLEHGADVEATTADGHRALDLAREHGHEQVATLLEDRLGP